MTIMKTLKAAAALLASLGAAPAFAQQDAATAALSSCLADNTSGRDRKDLMAYVFAGIAAHPDIKRLGNVSAADQTEINKRMGALMTRLLVENCEDEARTATRTTNSNAGINTAFGQLGQLAMKELISNPDVNAAMSGFRSYIDMERVKAVMAPSASASAPE